MPIVISPKNNLSHEIELEKNTYFNGKVVEIANKVKIHWTFNLERAAKKLEVEIKVFEECKHGLEVAYLAVLFYETIMAINARNGE